MAALREACSRAGLGPVELVSAPVAFGWHLLAGGAQLPAGAPVLISEIGEDACTATVLRRAGVGFEVMSSVDADTVAADRGGLNATSYSAADDGGGIGMPVGDVAARAVAGAELPPGGLALACAVGTAAADPRVGEELRQATGVEPMLVAEAELAVVLGAAQAPVSAVVVDEAAPEAGWTDLAAVIVPTAWSVALFWQFLAGGERYGPREKVYASGMLLAAWGGLAFAATFGFIAVVGGLVITNALRHSEDGRLSEGGADLPDWVRHRLIALTLLGGAVGGVLVAAVYAMVAAGYFDLDIGPLLRWSVLPVVPAAVVVLLLGVVVWRHPTPPGGSWVTWLRFPLPVTLLAGALLLSYDEVGRPLLLDPLAYQLQQWFPTAGSPIIGPVGRLGGLLIGAAVGLLVVRRLLHRLLFAVPMALLVAGALAWRVTGTGRGRVFDRGGGLVGGPHVVAAAAAEAVRATGNGVSPTGAARSCAARRCARRRGSACALVG
ncbi:hypothetical protein GCM10027610_072400 [Dactylosporangium cerinum]